MPALAAPASKPAATGTRHAARTRARVDYLYLASTLGGLLVYLPPLVAAALLVREPRRLTYDLVVDAALLLPIAAIGGAVYQAITWLFRKGATERSRKIWFVLLVLAGIGCMPAQIAMGIIFYALGSTLR